MHPPKQNLTAGTQELDGLLGSMFWSLFLPFGSLFSSSMLVFGDVYTKELCVCVCVQVCGLLTTKLGFSFNCGTYVCATRK